MQKPYNYQISLGDRFGRLTVIGLSITSRLYHQVRCDCGTVKKVRRDGLYTGAVQSCGCYAKDSTRKRFTKHGMAGVDRPAEYDCWAHMLRRCYTPSTKGFENYGGRGITVCDRWRYSFDNFLADMGERPSSKYSIDRLDNNGNYEPDNCAWRTQKEQSNNIRRNVRLTYRGETLTVAQWSDRLGFGRELLPSRIRRGWTVERALTTPPMKQYDPRNRTAQSGLHIGA